MSDAFIISRGGGSGLRFLVKAYSSESDLPATSSKNTIAVITSIDMTGYVFSADAPSSPATGLVWVNTSYTCTSDYFTVETKDGLLVYYVTECKQWDGSAWVSLAYVIYIDGVMPRVSTVSVYGAPNETITYSGVDSSSVKLDIDGYGSVYLNTGEYTFTGSTSGYSVTKNISTNTSVQVYPDGMLYWYGRFADGYTAGGTNQQPGAPSVIYSGYLMNDMANGYYGSLYLTPAVARGSYTTFKAVANLNTQNGESWSGTIGLATNTGYSGSDSAYGMVAYATANPPGAKVTYSIDISGLDSSAKYYVKLHNYGYECYLYAAWLE